MISPQKLLKAPEFVFGLFLTNTVFDGFLGIFGVFGTAVSLRQGLSDKLLGLAIAKSIVELQGRTSGLKHE